MVHNVFDNCIENIELVKNISEKVVFDMLTFYQIKAVNFMGEP